MTALRSADGDPPAESDPSADGDPPAESDTSADGDPPAESDPSAQSASGAAKSGGGPLIRRFDDPGVPWQRVKAQRNRDGSESSVWEKWFAFSPDPPYLSLYARYDPGMVVRRHGHRSPHVVFVIDGDLLAGDVVCGPGTHIELAEGEQFGPLVAGDRGARLFEVMLGDPRSWSDDPDSFAAACAERGVTPLPDPGIDFPDWLEDLRGRFDGFPGEDENPGSG